MSDMIAQLTKLDPLWLSQLFAFINVVVIDLVMAGDNAVAVGLAAAGLPPAQRRKAILYGLIGAVVTRLVFVLLTVQLLKIVGLLLAGGLLLLWVAWKMWHELRQQHTEGQEDMARAEASIEDATGINIDQTDQMGGAAARSAKQKTLMSAVTQILVADVSMSLDNVLAVSGAASDHIGVLVFGLLLSIALMGVAAHAIASVLHRYRFIGYIGLLIIVYVAGHMIYEGTHQILVQTDCHLDMACVNKAKAFIDHLQMPASNTPAKH